MSTRPTLLVACGDEALAARTDAALSAADDVDVLVAATADEARELLAERQPDALIASDVTLLARARHVAPDLITFLMADPSAARTEDLVVAINERLVDRFIPRDAWVAGEMLAEVRQLLAERGRRREHAAELERLSRRVEALQVLRELSAAVSDGTRHGDIADVLARSLDRLLPVDLAAVLISGDGGNAVLHLHCRAPVDDHALMAARDRCVELHLGLAGRSTGEVVVAITGDRLGDAAQPTRAISTTHVPLAVDGRAVGLVYAATFRPRAFSSDDEAILHLVADEISAAIRRVSTRILDERRRMALMVESMADGIIMTDEKSEVFLINAGARRMLGLPADVVITSKYLKEKLGFYPFDLVAMAQAAREELKIGDKTLHSIVSPVHDGAGKPVGVVVVLRDITEWKELERRKEDFVSVVSHELRTPLTSIAGALDIVLQEYVGNVSDKQRRYLEMARQSCGRLHVIIDDLLDVARFERGKMPMQFRPLSLDRLASECVERFRPPAEAKQVQLVLRNDASGVAPVRIVGDADRLTQVMNNLLSNAVKFTPDGGRVEIEVFGPGVASAHVGVSVWNNGDAIREEDRERVFDKFEQVQASTTRRVGGTGLGLSISRAIIEGHGGKIWVENERVGTKFVFTLPAAPAGTVNAASRAAETREVTPGADEKAAESGRQVLVVDDDRYAAYLLKGVLMASGHRVHVAHDADEALTIARERRPDLITVDVRMPGVDGLALVEILKHDPDTRQAGVIVVSAVDAHGTAITAGADVFLPKPVDIDHFRDTCARLLAERRGAAQIKVLVADDDPGIRMICREVLENAGYVVREAQDGESALAEAKRFRPDLVLLDVMMPDLDGFQAAKRFRADRASAMTPVIFVSARGQTADKVRAFKLGAEDYLVKPFDSAELVARVEKALERRERELGASPTTMLPGAGAIEAEIADRIEGRGDYAFCYLDLDNLKAFNDFYGIAKADGVIKQTGDLVREVIAREGSPGDFIGHIAGDDFVFIVGADRVDRVCRTICQSFDRLIPLYYNKIDRERGHIETHDRYGVLRKFPIMSVSIAALTLLDDAGPRYGTYAELASAAAEEKHRAKSVDGSSYVRDGVVILPQPVKSATVA